LREEKSVEGHSIDQRLPLLPLAKCVYTRASTRLRTAAQGIRGRAGAQSRGAQTGRRAERAGIRGRTRPQGKLQKARTAIFERIVQNAPATFTAAQLRVLLRASLTLTHTRSQTTWPRRSLARTRTDSAPPRRFCFPPSTVVRKQKRFWPTIDHYPKTPVNGCKIALRLSLIAQMAHFVVNRFHTPNNDKVLLLWLNPS
jgi:hypothetical protein